MNLKRNKRPNVKEWSGRDEKAEYCIANEIAAKPIVPALNKDSDEEWWQRATTAAADCSAIGHWH